MLTRTSLFCGIEGGGTKFVCAVGTGPDDLRAETFSPEHPAWDLEAQYIALAIASYICTLSLQRIVLDGSVPQQPQLMPLIRQKVQADLNSYVQSLFLFCGVTHEPIHLPPS
jgi:hypothetical protein